MPPATRTARSAHSTMQAWTPRAERCRPKMVLEGISPPTWSGLWRETDHPSLSALRMISPDPLQTQSPAHHLPAVRSTSPSPPMMESHFPPRSASQRKAERLSGRSPRKLSPNPSDQVREPATVPTTREPAVDGVSAEWSSASCTAAEGELIVHLGLLDMGGDLIDWSTELEIELPPLLSPSSPLVPSSPPSSPLVPASSAPPECPPGRGAICHVSGLFCVFCSPCVLWPSFSLMLIVNLIPGVSSH